MLSWKGKGRKKANLRDNMCSESEMLKDLSRLLRAGGAISGVLKELGNTSMPLTVYWELQQARMT